MKKKIAYYNVALLLVFLIIIFAIFTGISPRYSPVFNSEWKKGPLMDRSSPYTSQKAPKIFLASVIIFEMLFVFFSFLFHLAIRKGLIVYTKWRSIIMVSISILGALVIVEAGLRWYIKKYSITHFRPHPVLLWQIRPNLRNFVNYVDKEQITTNSLGLRGKEAPFRKGPDDFRILVLGDSANFGHGVENDETWEHRLEGMLEEKFPSLNIQVINGACPGYTTYEGLVFLKTIGTRFHPDILIIGFNNDPCKDFMEDKERLTKNAFITAIRKLMYKSDFYLLFRQTAITIGRAFRFRRSRRHSLNSYSDYNVLNYAPQEEDKFLVPRVSLKDYERNIHNFIEIARKNGIYLIFMKMPINRNAVRLKQRFYNPLYSEMLKRICLESHQALVDIDSRWLSVKKNSELFLPGHLQHPNKKGHLKIAQQVYEIIIQKKLIR